MSKPHAIIDSFSPQSSRAFPTASAFPVESSVFVTHSSWLSFSWAATTARRLTFQNPPRSVSSFPSKFICPFLQEKFSFTFAAPISLAVARLLLVVDLLREMLSTSPPEWFIKPAVSAVNCMLETPTRSARGPIFFIMFLGIWIGLSLGKEVKHLNEYQVAQLTFCLVQMRRGQSCDPG